MRAKKSLGQNFLMHAAIADRITDAAQLSPSDTVLEIGPGTGMLTRALLARAARVIAIEADDELEPQLRETFAPEIAEGRLTLIHGDAREVVPETIREPYALVANIPYYITGELLRKFLGAKHKPVSLTFLVQKEVAERIARAKKESLSSLAVKVYGTPRYCFTVPRGSFTPAPKVDSAVLSVRGIHNPFVTEAEELRFFEILHAGFAHKRKFLAGNLSVLAPAGRIREVFPLLGIPEKVRAEDVSLETWKALAATL